MHDVRGFLGIANQLEKFSPHLSTLSQPPRALPYRMLIAEHSPKIDTVKVELCKDTCLRLYNPILKTKLSAGLSSNGIGVVLFRHASPNMQWCDVACASRSTAYTEMSYAQTEKQSLAITWAASRLEMFLLGMPCFLVETDHK